MLLLTLFCPLSSVNSPLVGLFIYLLCFIWILAIVSKWWHSMHLNIYHARLWPTLMISEVKTLPVVGTMPSMPSLQSRDSRAVLPAPLSPIHTTSYSVLGFGGPLQHNARRHYEEKKTKEKHTFTPETKTQYQNNFYFSRDFI